MNVSIIGYSDRVKKLYLNNYKFKIVKILRKKKIEKDLYTSNLRNLIASDLIIISLKSKKTSLYIRKLIKMNYKGKIIIETPSIDVIDYYLYFRNTNIYVMEEIIFNDFILKIRKIIKREKIIKIYVINRGFMILYHFLSIIYFWNNKKIPLIYKKQNDFFYFRSKYFFIKTNLKKTKQRTLFIKLVTNKNKYKFNIKNSDFNRIKSINFYTKLLINENNNVLNIKDYNILKLKIYYLKIYEKTKNFLRI